MLEAAAVPALLKAVDWIFGESGKILQQRRERAREAKRSLPETEPARPDGPPLPPDSDAITAREAALHAPIEEALWRGAEMHVKHLLSLLEIHTANYHLAREQYAKHTSAYVPPIVVHTLTEAEDKIIDVTKELQSLLSTIYKRQLTTPELKRV